MTTGITDVTKEEVTTQSTAAAGGAVEPSAAASSAREVWRRFAENKLALLGLALIAVLILTAVFAPLLAPYDPYDQDLENTLAPPSSEHWLGTDPLGRDQLSRLIYGSRIAVVVGLASIVLATIIGVALGALAGWYGGRVDSVVMRVADVFFAFPLLIGAIVIILVLGRGVLPVVLSLAIFSWATVARLQRSSILSVRESDYVMAARALGAGGWRLLSRHVLPNSFAPVLVYATFSVGVAVVAEASLSFLGVGVRADVPEWGNMIAVGRSFVGSNDYLWLFPSLAVVLTVLGFVFAGDGLRDALDPRLT
jgi:peptide/nickel transport system permease protein